MMEDSEKGDVLTETTSQEKGENKDEFSSSDVSISEDGKNEQMILCKRCSSKILKPHTANHVEAEKQLGDDIECDAVSVKSIDALEVATTLDVLWLIFKTGCSLVHFHVTFSMDRIYIILQYLPFMERQDLITKVREGETLNHYWCVDDIYTFENIGFSHTVGTVKYLTCADCEIGPIGWHDCNNKKSYVSLKRVLHS